LTFLVVGKTITEHAGSIRRLFVYGETADGVVYRINAKKFDSSPSSQVDPDDIENEVELFSVISFKYFSIF
jgi:hypothetical protein